jgi:hypothetical protein
MQLFTCQHCGNVVYFENTRCESCGFRLGFDPALIRVVALQPDGDGFDSLAQPDTHLRFCANAEHDACNWLVQDHGHTLCRACRYNRVIPDLSEPENLRRWRLIELAKHRLIYTMIKLDLPAPTWEDNAQTGLGFEFLADDAAQGAPRVMTGHEDGTITLALREADDVERTTLRQAMGEPYRTMLGHFRHEVGHYFWDRLVRDGGRLEECRAVFGDDRDDYEASLQTYYKNGPKPDWQLDHISAYATAHPWEDFAETWAHYLHIVDTLDTAVAFGIRVQPQVPHADVMEARLACDPYTIGTARALVDGWLPLTYAVNNLNRSMGQPDLYPFVLSPGVLDKLEFIHRLIHRRTDEPAGDS